MSSCSLIEFRGGKPDTYEDYGNSWGGAAFIWTAIFDKWLKDPNIPYDNWMNEKDRRLWDAWKRSDLPDFVKAVLVSTFDGAIVARENFAQYAADLRQFCELFPKGDRYCHLLKWADVISASDAEHIGFHHTSVSEDPWQEWNEEKAEYVPYDLATGDDHFDVYQFLASPPAESAM